MAARCGIRILGSTIFQEEKLDNGSRSGGRKSPLLRIADVRSMVTYVTNISSIMTTTFIRNLTAQTRTKRSDMQLGIILAFVAGAINAGGFLAINYYTSHMTGVVSSIADAIALHQWNIALMAVAFLLSFTCGAATSAIIINIARAKKLSSDFAFALMLEAVLLLAFGLSASADNAFSFSVGVTICLLCFIMGLQNAMITKISNAEVRTTHVTGIVTDIGIEIGRYIYSAFGSNKPGVRRERLKLYSGLLASFLIGGIVGAVSFKAGGFITTVPLALLLAALAALPMLDDARRK